MKRTSAYLLVCVLFSLTGFSFVKKVGQVAPHVLYYGDFAGCRLYITHSYLCLQTVRAVRQEGPDAPGKHGRTVDISYVYIDLPEGALIEPLDKSATYVNIFKGKDPKAWHTHIPVYLSLIHI